MKRIVILAFDCNPYLESESLISFKTAFYMSKENEVIVITRPNNQNDIQRWKNENQNSNLTFCYVDSVKFNKRYNQAKSFLKLFYLGKYIDKWFELVVNKIKEIEEAKHIDIIYRVGPNSFRRIPDLSDFKDSIKIIGPVGGAQEIPNSLSCLVHGKNKVVEYFHKKINDVTLKKRKFIKNLNSFDFVFCCNEETYNALKLIYNKSTIEILTDVGIDADDIVKSKTINTDHCVNFLWVGRFVFRKGLDLLMKVLSEIKNQDFKLTFVGDGPDFDHVKSLSEKYGLSDKVVFVGRVPKAKTNDYYKAADVFLFPSLRESSGGVLAEALENRLPVIALDMAGAKTIVPKDCGKLINVDQSYDEIVNEFKKSIEYYLFNKDFKRKFNTNFDAIIRKIEWENKIHTIFETICGGDIYD